MAMNNLDREAQKQNEMREKLLNAMNSGMRNKQRLQWLNLQTLFNKILSMKHDKL